MDLIDRDLLLEKMADYVASGYADSVEDFEEYSKIVCQMPSVQRMPTMVYPQVDGITPTVVAVKKSFRDTWEQTE